MSQLKDQRISAVLAFSESRCSSLQVLFLLKEQLVLAQVSSPTENPSTDRVET